MNYDSAVQEFGDGMPNKRITGCACFAPGEVPDSCPGVMNCPLQDDDDE